MGKVANGTNGIYPVPTPSSSSPKPMPKNLVVIVTDTLRHPGLFPGLADGSSMPFLRGLAAQGVDFSRAIASSCWTPPSHVSLLSGTDPWLTHFHVASRTSEVPSQPFLADLWTRRGGTSAAFSANWLVAPQVGTARGYEHFNAGLPTGLAGLALQGIQVIGYEQYLYARIQRMATYLPGRPTNRLDRWAQFGGTAFHRAVRPLYSGGQVARAVHRYLRRRDRTLPLHLFVNLNDMHEPYDPPAGRTSPGLDLEYLPSVNLARHTQALAHWGGTLRMMDPYAEAGRRLDAALESIVADLRSDGVLEDATMLVVSDHGQALGEHSGAVGHAFFLFDELVRIPACYFEFRGGRPVLAPVRNDAWVDLRHLFDLVKARGIEERDDPIDRVLSESVARRGPAAAFWEGPTPHPPRGFLLSAPRSTYQRTVRVFGDEGSCSMDDRGNPLDLGTPAGPAPDALIQYAEKAVGLSRATAAPEDRGQRNAAVDRRLRSWGYD